VASGEEIGGIICGFHPVEEALVRGKRHLGTLYLARNRQTARTRRLEKLARDRGMKIKQVDTRTLDRLAASGNHQGIVATVEVKAALDLEDLLGSLEEREPSVVVVLDGVQDPHNLGAVIRNCALTQTRAVILPRDRTTGITPVVEKVAAGGLEHVDVVRVGNLAAALRRLKDAGFWTVGADAMGEIELPAADLDGRLALIIGDEHRGLRRLTKEHCDQLVRIPTTGAIGSYNVGMAAGLFLFFAFLRHRSPE
jgi:23S rRNA (guanosine2251-2'-O)-methyltransferase